MSFIELSHDINHKKLQAPFFVLLHTNLDISNASNLFLKQRC